MKLPEWLQLVKGDLDETPGEVTMLLQAPIGYNKATNEGISARMFGDALGAIHASKKVSLDINTMGGSVDQGLAMANMVLARGNVTTRVVGYAASMGAIIHQAGAKRVMMPGTLLVIHNPHANLGDGDYRDAGQKQAFLKQVRDNLSDMLAKRSGQKVETINDMMDSTTAMGPEDAKRLGFCDEIVEGTAARNDMSPVAFFDFFKSLSNKTSNNLQENVIMKLTLTALGKLVKLPENITDELAAPQVESSLTALIAERDNYKAQVEAAKASLLSRVTNRVTKAVEAKLVKPDRKDDLIAIGVSKESALDFLDDIAVGSPARRGAPPVPKTEGENDTIESLRAQLNESKDDPKACADISLKLRNLRGHKDLFAAS